MTDVLMTSSNVMLVHCKNGKDRSAFVIYAFLRLLHSYTHEAAMAILAQHRGASGEPLFNYKTQDSDLLQWLGRVASEPTEFESGLLSWRAGSS